MTDVSLNDIALQCGVSPSTVSRVLNDQPGVSARTRARVLDVVRQLSYVRSAAARTLSTNKTGSIGVLHYRRKFPRRLVQTADLTAAIAEEAGAAGYHVVSGVVGESELKLGHNLPMVRERRIDGIIAVGPNLTPSFLLDIAASGTPIVTVDSVLRNTEIDCVLYENEEPVYLLTRHLIEQGHRRIYFISGPSEWVSSEERCRGYTRAVIDAGLEPRVIVMDETLVESGESAMSELVATRDIPSAVVAANDAMAIGVCRVCKRNDIRIPQDLAVTGYDDIDWATLHDPPLTTVRSHPDEMGRQALRRIVEIVEAPPGRQHVRLRLRVAAETVFRRSSGGDAGPA